MKKKLILQLHKTFLIFFKRVKKDFFSIIRRNRIDQLYSIAERLYDCGSMVKEQYNFVIGYMTIFNFLLDFRVTYYIA